MNWTRIEPLVSALKAFGRREVAKDLQLEGACRGYSQTNLQDIQAFDRLMICGCHTCADCLFVDGNFQAATAPCLGPSTLCERLVLHDIGEGS